MLVAPALFGPESVAAQDSGEIAIERVEWGFDGKAVQRGFTPLSVLISNPSPGPAEGTIRLSRSIQLTSRVGAVHAEDFYISAGESRWVQFTPYVMGDWESWALDWGPARSQCYDVPTPNLGDPAVVMVDDPDDLSFGGSLKRFDQALFPVSVTGTDSLGAIALDFAPDWQGARAQAFVEWLRRGGRVYVLLGPDGQYPEFPSALDPLNQTSERVRVGAGLVKRLPLRSSDLTRETVQSLILDDERPTAQSGAASRQTPYLLGRMIGWDRDRQLFIDLESLARFHRNWWLIYIAVFLYLLAIYPGCYSLGRNVANVRVFYAGFFGCTALFSVLFTWLGDLGSSEVSRARSAAIAYQLEDGLYDVTQWSSVAVVNGGEYELKHGGSGRLYSTCQEIEAVDGTITTGANGALRLDMPPVSTRTVLHRTRLPAPGLGLRLDGFLADEMGLSSLNLSTGAGFPRDVEAAFAAHRGRIHALHVGDGRLALADRGTATTSFLNDLELFAYQFRQGAWGVRPVETEIDEEDLLYDSSMRTLIGNSFGLRNQAAPETLNVPPDLVRVFVYAPLPPEFFVAGRDFPDQTGRVLYVVDLPVAGDASREAER